MTIRPRPSVFSAAARPARRASRISAVVVGILSALGAGPAHPAGAPLLVPAAGDVIINEYASDNDANDNDFFELLVVGDRVDLRGLRVTDNELVGATLNNGESVFTFGADPFLAAVPKGTLIAVWTTKAGVTTDTTVNPAANDWKMVLAPGVGVAAGNDRLGGEVNTGLANGGDNLYVYLPGPNGNSTGTDNVYLDYVSWEDGDDAVAPAGVPNLNLPDPADNAYYFSNTAAGNDSAVNWVRYDSGPGAQPTPGDPNPKQDLAALRRR